MVSTELQSSAHLWAPQETDRPKGLHLSQIISDLCKGVDPDRYDRGEGPPAAKLQTGVSFEQTLERSIAIVSPGGFRPHPIQRDGIWCSPDYINVDGQVEEFKCTWYSMAKSCPDHDVYWPWRVQIKAYCFVCVVLEAVLRVLFINGNYRPPSPVFKSYQLTFTPEELKQNWWAIKAHAIKRGWL